ncbi:hypothetical protein Clacol_007827 [Clathrus columnatus]|uniref:Uncharacterized protein n=1 Tax=Clathrus columnatus TaxID=1419009 RepID=A0AAV5AIQ3_9AGAM|nr:hypothetical protein Clacol_007827 [Clathrus columnatus]
MADYVEEVINLQGKRQKLRCVGNSDYRRERRLRRYVSIEDEVEVRYLTILRKSTRFSGKINLSRTTFLQNPGGVAVASGMVKKRDTGGNPSPSNNPTTNLLSIGQRFWTHGSPYSWLFTHSRVPTGGDDAKPSAV